MGFGNIKLANPFYAVFHMHLRYQGHFKKSTITFKNSYQRIMYLKLKQFLNHYPSLYLHVIYIMLHADSKLD